MFESDSTFQIIGQLQAGICCAMPLNNGLEALSDNLEIIPIAENRSRVNAGADHAQTSSRSPSLAEKCFADAVILITMAGGWEAPGAQWHIHLALRLSALMIARYEPTAPPIITRRRSGQSDIFQRLIPRVSGP